MKPTQPERAVVLVAGSRGVIGEALCRSFLARGDAVVGCSRGDTPIADERFQHYACDLSDDRAVADLFHRLDLEGMAPGVVVLNAAVFSPAMAVLIDRASVDATLAANVKAPLLVVREALKRMMPKRFGRIIAISSICVSQPERGAVLYSMSKAALEQLVKVLPFELGGRAITINAVEISLIEDSGMAAGLSAETRAALLQGLAIKRACTTADVCNAVEFFASAKSAYVTGQVLKLGFV